MLVTAWIVVWEDDLQLVPEPHLELVGGHLRRDAQPVEADAVRLDDGPVGLHSDCRVREPASDVSFQMRVQLQERLAAGEADFPGGEGALRDLVEIGARLVGGQIGVPVVARARLDIAVAAGQVAGRAGVEPQRIEPFEGDPAARLALGGRVRVAKLPGREGPKRDGGWIGHRSLYCPRFLVRARPA